MSKPDLYTLTKIDAQESSFGFLAFGKKQASEEYAVSFAELVID